MAAPVDPASASRRGLWLLLVGTLSACCLGLAVLVLWPQEDVRRRPERPRKAPRELAATPEPSVAPAPTPVLEPPPNMAEVSRAMDLSNIRVMVRSLMEAAALENKDRARSMLSALRRYGPSAGPVIQDEILTATNPLVRDTLMEALAQAR